MPCKNYQENFFRQKNYYSEDITWCFHIVVQCEKKREEVEKSTEKGFIHKRDTTKFFKNLSNYKHQSQIF